jgi:hypothetical protein
VEKNAGVFQRVKDSFRHVFDWENLKMSLLILLLLQSSILAHAQQQSYCQPPQEMTFTTCEENVHLIKAVDRCLKKIDKAAALRGLANIAATDSAAKTAQSKQTGRLQEAANAQMITLTNIELMIADVKNAMVDIDAYFDEIVLPEDADMEGEEMINGLDLGELAGQDCYRETLFTLDDGFSKLEEDLKSLEKAKEALEKMEKVTSSREGRLENSNASVIPNESSDVGKSAPTGAGKTGKDIRKSDISGTKENKKK